MRVTWACFSIEWYVFLTRVSTRSWCLTIGLPSDILAEFHQPRSGVELVVDRMSLPQYSNSSSTEGLYALADISARSLLNRIHHAIYLTDSLSLFPGLSQIPYRTISSTPNAFILRLCEELNRQLETWYESLPEIVRPALSGNPVGDGQAGILRLRYWSAKHNIHRPFVIYATSTAAKSQANIPSADLERCELCLSACRMFLLTAGHTLSERTSYTFSTLQWYVDSVRLAGCGNAVR